MANCNSDYPPNPYIILDGKNYYLEYKKNPPSRANGG